jgi:uncharacterized protein YukE
MTLMRYTGAIDSAGDMVSTRAQNIENLGQEMFEEVRNLIGNGGLTGEIATALEAAQTKWDQGCTQFAEAEKEFGRKMQTSYANQMATDRRGSGYFAV